MEKKDSKKKRKLIVFLSLFLVGGGYVLDRTFSPTEEIKRPTIVEKDPTIEDHYDDEQTNNSKEDENESEKTEVEKDTDEKKETTSKVTTHASEQTQSTTKKPSASTQPSPSKKPSVSPTPGTTKPTVPQTPDTPTPPVKHKHNQDVLIKSTKDGELRSCSVCGEKTLVDHTMGEEHIDKEKHKVVRECSTCSYVEEKDHNHENIQFVKDNGSVELYYCDDCGFEFTQEHEYEITYDKDTHEEIHTCTNPECGHTERHLHAEHPNYTVTASDDVNETRVCDDCGLEYQVAHVYGDPVLVTNDGTYDLLYTCTNPGCDHTKRELHTHTYELSSTDEEHEYWTCQCGAEEEHSHQYGVGVPQSDGTYLQTCPVCGQQKSYHTCIEGNRTKEFVGTKEVCYKIISVCPICGKPVLVQSFEHDLVDGFDTKICRNIGCTYTEPLTIALDTMEHATKVIDTENVKMTIQYAPTEKTKVLRLVNRVKNEKGN